VLKIVFAGTPEFALPSLEALVAKKYNVAVVYTQLDRPKGRGRRLLMSPIKKFALKHNIAVCQPFSLRDADEQKKLAAWQPDLMIVVAYGLILPRAVLTIPKLGCINVHASLLPRWRGAAPIQRAILAGDTESGITIMQMDAGLDTGPIVLQVACKIEKRDTCQTLQERLAQLGASALLTSLDNILQGNYSLQAQNDNDSSYAKKIDKAEAKIDWNQNAKTIERMIRAFNPKPIAYTFLGQLLVRVWSAVMVGEHSITNHYPPGVIVQVKSQGIDVMTGDGLLRLLQIQLPGRRCMPVSELLHAKSHLFRVGETLA
jgi:methionyl-tRNA formyltransferase